MSYSLEVRGDETMTMEDLLFFNWLYSLEVIGDKIATMEDVLF